METQEKATDWRNNPACSLTAHDELGLFEDNSLKPHVNSPVHEEANLEEVITPTSLHHALTKGMQIRIDEAARNLQNSRSKQHTDSPLAGTELIRRIFRDEGVEDAISSRIPWPEQLKTAAHGRWNLRELMQREEIEDDVGANLNALRTTYLPEQGSKLELGCLEELARSLVGKQYATKQEDSVGDCGTPRRLEVDIARLKHEEAQLHGVSRENTRTEPKTTPRNQFTAESMIQGVQGQKGRIARTPQRQNHVHSSCPGDNCRNADTKEEDHKLSRGQAASLPNTRKSVLPNDFRYDYAAVRELEVNRGTDQDDLEVLLQFLTMKQQLRENSKTAVEEVVRTEAIVRELLARMKLDSDCSSSIDSDASIYFLPRSHAGVPIMDDGCGEGGRKRRDIQGRSVDTSDATVRNVLARLTFEDSADPNMVSVHQNQNTDCQISRSGIRRPPFVVPSSSKSGCLQRTAVCANTRSNSTSCIRNYVNQSVEQKVATSPSRNSEEARKRSKRSALGVSQSETCGTIQSIVGNATDVRSEEVDNVGSHGHIVETIGSSTVTGMETVDEPNCVTQVLGNAEHDGISNETNVPHVPRNGDGMPLVSAGNLESQSFTGNASAMTPWNYQRERQLPTGRNPQLASPNKRSTPNSPSSPEHRRQCRDSPTRKSSPNNKLSPLSSPQRQLKPRAAMATSKTTAAQLGSPKRPSPLSSPQRQQKSRPALATLISTAAHVGSPKPNKTLPKEEAYDMMSTSGISKPRSHDPDIFPAGMSEAVVQESIALAKDSSDPYADFRDSMLEMMQEKNLWQRQGEQQDLLQCFLHLNQPVYHRLIHQAFSDVISFGSPVNYPDKSLKKEPSNTHFSRRSSPSRQLNYDVTSQPYKSPVRKGG